MGGFLSALAGAGKAAAPYNAQMLDLWQRSRNDFAKMVQETRDSSVYDPELHSQLTALLGKIHTAKPGADQSKLLQQYQELTTVHPTSIEAMKRAGVPGADMDPNPPQPKPGPAIPGVVPGVMVPQVAGVEAAAVPSTNPIDTPSRINIPPVGTTSPVLNWAVQQRVIPPAQMQLLAPVIQADLARSLQQQEWDIREKIAGLRNSGTEVKVVGNAVVAIRDGKAEVIYQGPDAKKYVTLPAGATLIDPVTRETIAKGAEKPKPAPKIFTQVGDDGTVHQWSIDSETNAVKKYDVPGVKGKTKAAQSPGTFVPMYLPGSDTPTFFNAKTMQTVSPPLPNATLKPETPDEKKARAMTTVTIGNFGSIRNVAGKFKDLFGPIDARKTALLTKYRGKMPKQVVEMERALLQARADIRQIATGLAFSTKETEEIIDRLPSMELPYDTFIARLNGVENDLRVKAAITTRGLIKPIEGMSPFGKDYVGPNYVTGGQPGQPSSNQPTSAVSQPKVLTVDVMKSYAARYGGDKTKVKEALRRDGYKVD